MDARLIPLLQLVALAISLSLVLLFGRPVIALLRRIGAVQRVRDDGPQRHLEKEGTPTMGGVLIVGAALAAVLGALLLPREWYVPMERLVTMAGGIAAFAGIGLADDWMKIKRGRSLGLKARHKLLLQFLAAAAFVLTLAAVGWEHAGGDKPFVMSEHVLRMVFWVFALVAASNAMNLADGLDGLASGLSGIAAVGFAAFPLLVPVRTSDVPVLGLAMAGACFGFLWFNRHPARVFMGDVGSLGLGAGLAAMAAVLNNPVLLVGLCIVPFAEELSVVGQVISFQTTRKRIIKMSPIHHHFELIGWSERRVVYTFWAVGAAASAVTVWVCLK